MPDEEVVGLARGGESDATEFLMARYRGLVESKAKAYFVVGADHDDVVQEGMIGLFKAIRDFRDDRTHRFRPFAELCVTRQIITAVKTATRHKHTPLNGSISLNQTIHDDSADGALIDLLPDRSNDDPGLPVMAEPIPSNIGEFVNGSLSHLEKDVLLSYLDGKSYREMSEELHCRTKSIDNALQRVKRKIGSLLRDERAAC